MAPPQALVIGGPNGAGKTTFAEGVLPTTIPITEYVNADVIAKGLSAYAPERVALSAGRIMLNRLRELAESRSTFAFETTLSTRSFAPFLSKLRSNGYEVTVVYVWLNSPDLAIRRVATRVLKGGHHVPDETVRRRYHRSAANLLRLYLPLAHRVRVYDNSNPAHPLLVAEKPLSADLVVYNQPHWSQLQTEANRAEEISPSDE